MAFASHLGPWLLGTVKNTTGTTAGTVRNMGATIVAQTADLTYSDAATSTAFWLPAGACITSIQFFSATGITATLPTLTVFADATQIASVSLTSGTAFAGALTFTAAAAATLANVGATDVAIKYTIGGTAPSAGTGTLVIAYIMRGADGAGNPAQS